MVTSKQFIVVFSSILHYCGTKEILRSISLFIVLILWSSIYMSDFAKKMASSSISSVIEVYNSFISNWMTEPCKHTTRVQRWNDVETTVSTSFQRAIRVVGVFARIVFFFILNVIEPVEYIVRVFPLIDMVFFSISWLICSIIFLLIFQSSFFVGLIVRHDGFL